MKRDFSRIRELLLAAEGSEEAQFELKRWCADPFDRYQIELLDEAGLVSIELFGFATSGDHPANEDYPSPSLYSDYGFRITWAGHEYLDTIRDEEIWKKTKNAAAQVGGATLGIVKDIALAYIRNSAAEKLGIAI